uniref:Cytosolic ca2+-dependent cysteine protease calpain n=1 Tax=Plectus sambesii TaxID=2011161 RepID=A0A914VHK1_9BILA
FWQYGHWVDVVVDDRLPTYDGKLVFMHSADNDEFWSALLEKAYAKLNGSYEALKGGSTSEAMEDFTGGLCEMFELRNPPKDLFPIMLKANERQSLMGCSLEADPNIFEARQSNGLVRGHAYSITDVKLVGRRLMSGCFYYNVLSSIEWSCVTEEEKVELGLVFAADGEFWISFPDFVKSFEKLEICHLTPEAAAYAVGTPNQSWACNNFEGVWTKNSTAGGCRNYLDTFAHNPQYHMKLTLADDDADNVCTCIIALLQKNRRLQRQNGINEMLTIGFAIYRVEDEKLLAEPLTREFFRTHQSAARSHAFINIREVCTRFRLPAGNYVVVPSTFEPNEEGEFMLRTFSEKPIKAENVDYDTKYQPVVPVPTVERKDEVEREDRFDQFFETLAGLDLEIDAWELQKIATFALKKEFTFDQFSIDTCRSMIAVVDLTRSGRLDLEEFKELWHSIRVWKSSFKAHDADDSGTISAFELGNALRDAGYTLPTRIITALSLRYANHVGQITFDEFIGCAVKLKTMMEIFQERDPKKTGEAKFNLEAWLELTMYA